MINMVRADLYKIWKSPVIKILFGLTSLSAVTVLIIANMIADRKFDASASGIAFLFSDISILSIMGGVAAGVFVCGDYDNKTLHQAITSGFSRVNIVMGKALSFFCAVFVIILPYAIAAVIAISSGALFRMGQSSLGFIYLVTSMAGNHLEAGDVIKLTGIIITVMVVYISQLSICVPLSFILKKPVLVVAIYYMISILSGQLIAVSEKVPWFKKIFQCTPYYGDYYIIDLSVSGGIFGRAILVSIVFIVLMIMITYFGFRKMEVK